MDMWPIRFIIRSLKPNHCLTAMLAAGKGIPSCCSGVGSRTTPSDSVFFFISHLLRLRITVRVLNPQITTASVYGEPLFCFPWPKVAITVGHGLLDWIASQLYPGFFSHQVQFSMFEKVLMKKVQNISLWIFLLIFCPQQFARRQRRRTGKRRDKHTGANRVKTTLFRRFLFVLFWVTFSRTTSYLFINIYPEPKH